LGEVKEGRKLTIFFVNFVNFVFFVVQLLLLESTKL